MLSRRSLTLALAAGTALPLIAGAQAPRALTKPDAEFEEPFTQVTGVRELKDGRVVVIDSRDKIVQVVDFKAGSGVKVGREGSGPGEYAFPMRLVPLPGDSSGVYDMLNSRMLVVLPNGKPGPFITIEQPATQGPGGGMVRIAASPPRYADARGGLYWLGQPFAPSDGGGPPKMADSVPVIRYDRATKRTDSLAWVRQAKGNIQTSGGGGNVQMRVGVANPFAPRDEWAVTPDGRVAVFRSPEYRVDWYGPTGQSSSTTIAYERIKVTEKHKEQWQARRRQQTTLSVSVVNGQRTVRTGPAPTDIASGPWPEWLPPFLEGAVYAAPDGRIWVTRTRPADDSAPALDVIAPDGRRTMSVRLPTGVRVVGVGTSHVYAVRIDDDDLQYLQRYVIPTR